MTREQNKGVNDLVEVLYAITDTLRHAHLRAASRQRQQQQPFLKLL